MKDITIVLLGDSEINYANIPLNVGLVRGDSQNFELLLKNVKTKYITFVKTDDELADNYFNLISSKVLEDFDCCFINYNLDCVSDDVKILTNEKELSNNIPYYGSYIWNYIFKTEIFKNMLNYKVDSEFNKQVDSMYVKRTAIGQVIYNHKVSSNSYLSNFCYRDIRQQVCLKNVIYVGGGCNGTFNGYISWIKNIGRCFGNDFEVTILYDAIPTITLNVFLKYFKCIKYNHEVDYLCERLLLTHSTYYYKKNIFALESNYMFIHASMGDYQEARRYKDDIYNRYIAVSQFAAKKAVGYFPTDNIEYLLNPFVIDEDLLKPHLKLVSAQRSAPVKRPERIEILASIFDELEIPYTWNVFMDKNENTNKNGLIYRRRVVNPLPYVADADYFVLLSDSEALPYSALEALTLNTKVIVTPLESFKELGVVDNDNGYVIPFEYFEPENKDKLIEIVKKVYSNKEKEFNYKYDSSLYDGYRDIFK